MGSTSLLSMMEARMPPGFRFHPRDEELILDYLAKKISNAVGSQMMIDVDLNKVEPWDLPAEACVGGKEWYFFSLRDRKYATGQRTNRATVSGYWKATGKDRPVVVDYSRRHAGGGNGAMGGSSNNNALVGMRKTLVFYKGRAPKGKKTDWVMHEFRMESALDSLCVKEEEYAHAARPLPSNMNNKASSSSFPSKEDWVLCRVFYKSRTLLVKPAAAASIPGAATATTATTTTGDNCYDDTAGSSTAALMVDAFMSMEQHHLAPQQQFNLQAYNEQVPCFSNIISSSSSKPPPTNYHPLVSFPPIRTFTQLVTLPDFSPFVSSISAADHKPPPGPHGQGGSAGSFVDAQGGVQPMWS